MAAKVEYKGTRVFKDKIKAEGQFQIGESYITENHAAALEAANSPSAVNPIATLADIGSGDLPNVFEFNNPFFYDTKKKGHIQTQNLMAEPSVGPVCYYFEGVHKRFYFVYFEGRKDAGANVRATYQHKSWICYYDVDTKTFTTQQSFTELYPDSDDIHNLPIIIVADDGHILVFKEDLDFTGAPGIHNSHIEVWRSDSAEDISAFTKVTALGDWVPEVAFSYPRVYKLEDGTLFLYVRDKIGGEERYQSIMRSIDNGLSWTDIQGNPNARTVVVDYTTAGWFLYHRPVYSVRSNGISIIVVPRHSTAAQGQKAIYIYHTVDGLNWINTRQFVEGSGGYSHDVVALSNLEKTDLDANYDVDTSVLLVADTGLAPVKGSIGPDKIPYIIALQYAVSTTPKMNKVTNFYLYYYDIVTHDWIKTDILPALERSGDSRNLNLLYGTTGHIISYGSGKVDIIVNIVSDYYNLLTGETIKATGTLIPGLIYRIVTTELNHFGTGVIIGDIIRPSTAYTCDANNTVVVMKTAPMLFRTENYGASFQYLNLDNIYNKHGVGWGTIGANDNFPDTKEIMLMYSVNESTNFAAIDFANIVCYNSKIQ